MRISPRRCLVLAGCWFVLAFGGAALPAQSPLPGSTTAPAPSAVQWSLLPPPLLQAFDVHAGTVQLLQVPQQPGALVGIDVRLAGQPITIELTPYDPRASGFQLWTRTATGLVAVPAGPATTWRGTLVGDPGSDVAATLFGGSLTAHVRTGAGELWIVQPLRDAVPTAPAAAHVVFRGADGAPVQGHCGVTAGPVNVPPSNGGTDVQYVCDLALEADFPLYQLNGSNLTATQNDVLGIVNAVDLIYRNNVSVHFVVTQLIVDTTTDPYTTTVPGTLLTQFQGQWNAAHAAIPRDVAHLLTGRNIAAASGGVVGLAYVGVVCSVPNAYGLSQTRFTNNYAYRVAVTAHELGHTFNASHCDGQPACSIMCSGVGGCTGNPGAFGAYEQAQIVAFRQSAGCLAAQPTTPILTSATPAQVATLNPPVVTLTGSGLLGTTAVTIGSTQLTTGLQVIGDTQLRFTPPAGTALGGQPLSVTNPAGTSNALLLTFLALNPCQVLVPSATYGGASFQWRMGGWPNDPAFLGISLLNTTSPVLGQPVLDGFLLLWTGVLDARGLATLPVTVPPGLLTGYTFYSQMLDVDPATNTLRSVSTTPSSWIVF